MSKNLILIRHFGSNHHFCLVLLTVLSIYVADKNTNALQKTERKNIRKCQSYAPFNFSRHLGHQTLSWIWQKKIFCKMFPTKIQAHINKQNAKMFKTPWVVFKKWVFSHFENSRHFENLWKDLLILLKFWSFHIYTKSGKKLFLR
jgi:hypothetical protein